MKGLRLCALAAVVLCSASLVLAEDALNVVRFDALYVMPSGDFTRSGVTIEADDAFGAGISYERHVTDLFGMQFGLGWSDHDVLGSTGGFEDTVGSLSQSPLYVNFLFHPFPADWNVDMYVGPGLAYIFWGDLETESQYGGGSVDVDDEATWTARVGLDIELGDRWAINVDGQYYQSSASAQGEDIKVNPYIVGAGIAYRF